MKNVIQIPAKYNTFLKKHYIWICLVVLGIIFLLISTMNNDVPTPANEPDFCQAYIDNLEKKLSNIVCEVAGVKECSVMITLKSGIEYVYATDESANTNENTQGGDKKEQSEEKIAIVTDKQTGEQAVIVTEQYPQINGVAIICHAPNSSTLTLAVKNAASTALGVDPGKVCVILKG
jgi:stage III sporulation protein AG